MSLAVGMLVEIACSDAPIALSVGQMRGSAGPREMVFGPMLRVAWMGKQVPASFDFPPAYGAKLTQYR